MSTNQHQKYINSFRCYYS